MSFEPPHHYNASPEKSIHSYKRGGHFMKDEYSHRISNHHQFHNRNKSFDLILNNQHLHNNIDSVSISQKNINPHDKSLGQGGSQSCWGSCKQYTLNGKKFNNLADSFTNFENFKEDLYKIAISDSHLLIQTTKGKIWVCGRNELNQLGGNFGPICEKPAQIEFPLNSNIQIEKISVGSDFNFALSSKNEVFSWGFNMRGQLGLGHYENVKSPTLVGSLSKGDPTNIIRISRSFMKKPKELDNDHPVDPNSSQLASSERVVEIACGGLHSLALTNRNRIFATGFGDTYALGLDTPTTICSFKEVSWFSQAFSYAEPIERLSCGVSHSGCIINGKVYLWGIMGLNSKLHYKSPILVNLPTGSSHLGSSYSNIHGKDLIASKKSYQKDHNDQAIDIKLGDLLTVVLSKKGDVFTMGENNYGQLGIANNSNSENLQYTQSFRKVIFEDASLSTNISSIVCGNNHVFCYSKDTRNIYAWGCNAQGQILPHNQKEEKIGKPMRIDQLKSAHISRFFAGPHITFAFSKVTPEFPNPDQPPTTNNTNFTNDDFDTKKSEIDGLKKVNTNMTTENEKLKTEIIGLNLTLTGLEKEKLNWTASKRGFLSNACTQTTTTDSANSEIFDVMQHFKKKLKQERTLKPDFEIDFNELTIEKRIGEGGFGIIYRARWRESTIAVKVQKPDLMREETIKDFLNESSAMESVRHPNICMFLGACTKLPNLAIVQEYCSRETLWKILQNKEISLTWEDKRRIALEIARGMNYLHTFPIPVLHRDLKSLNILMDEGFRPKIADFGWTRKMSEKMTGKIGTYQWMAPEVIKSQKYTEKADVFSFAIILWEIASREPPYRNITGAQVSLDVVNNDLRPTIPKNTPESFARIMKSCWDRHPEKRPSFKEIIRDIENMKLPKY